MRFGAQDHGLKDFSVDVHRRIPTVVGTFSLDYTSSCKRVVHG